MSHSRKLREKIELVAPGMHRAIHAFWTHPRIHEIFPEFLFTTYCVGRSTVPLLELAHTAGSAYRSAVLLDFERASDCVIGLPGGFGGRTADRRVSRGGHSEDWSAAKGFPNLFSARGRGSKAS